MLSINKDSKKLNKLTNSSNNKVNKLFNSDSQVFFLIILIILIIMQKLSISIDYCL